VEGQGKDRRMQVKLRAEVAVQTGRARILLEGLGR
jgi:hypothetical protein